MFALRLNLPELALARCAAWLAVAAALAAPGCANCRLPRIDPTGERLFVWGEPTTPPPTLATAPPFNPGGVALPGAATLPYPGAEATTSTPIPSISIPTPGLPPGAVPTPGLPTSLPMPGITVSPSQVIAPVGSEVVMIAGIMGDEGFPLTREKVEWTLNPDGPATFVSPGVRRPWEILNCLHSYPKKISPVYAVNRTLTSPMLIDRGTPTPADDITVRDGQAWVSVTSASEGTSHVTVFAPNVKGWDRRQQSATIYWVDAQWRLPSPGIAPAGGRSTLTTVVTRSNGQPLPGWVVRYEIAGGPPGGFSPNGATSIEVVTNAAGEAPVEVVQQAPTPGTNLINIQVIRPPAPGSTAPQLPVGTGSTQQTWTGGDATLPYSPPVQTVPGQSPPTFVPVVPPVGSTPPVVQPAPFTPTQPPVTAPPVEQPPIAQPQTPLPTTPVPSGQPQLTVTINEPPLAVVGSDAQFEVQIENRGTATATGLLVKDHFDDGLEHSSDPTKRTIERNLTDLHPGETTRLPVTFRITKAGELCQEVTVTSLNFEPVTARKCVTATESPLGTPQTAEPAPAQPTPIQPAQPSEPAPTLPPTATPSLAAPRLTVTKRGPTQRRVNERALFEIVVTNNTDHTFQNVEIADNHEISLQVVQATEGSEWLPGGALGWKIATLEPGRTVRRQIELTCLRETPRACNRVTVTATDMEAVADEACLEIIAGPGAPEAPAPVTPEDTNAPPQISVSAIETADPIRANGQTSYQVILTNKGDNPARDVAVRITFDENLQLLQHGGPVRGSATTGAITYPAIRELRVGETQTFDLRFKGVAPGTARVQVEVTATGLASPIRSEQTTEVLP